ncbi:hypothetical protein [Yoonia algicola]|uniref:Uncharacterized protein n=1 Tax=Yoonia algicola TaxID=3137368 RepID=A0AAN0M0L4_9RHOB
MGVTQNPPKNRKEHRLLRKPERLWAHYCFALVIVLCLIVASYIQNRGMVERGLLAAEAIQSSNEQVLIIQNIVTISDEVVRAGATDLTNFDNAVLGFETIYAQMLATQRRSQLFDDDIFSRTSRCIRKSRHS